MNRNITFKEIADYFTGIIQSKYMLLREVDDCLPSISYAGTTVLNEINSLISFCIEDNNKAIWPNKKDKSLEHLFAWASHKTVNDTCKDTSVIKLFVGTVTGPVDTGFEFIVEPSQVYENKALRLTVQNNGAEYVDNDWQNKEVLATLISICETHGTLSADNRALWVKLPQDIATKSENYVCPNCGHRGCLEIDTTYFEPNTRNYPHSREIREIGCHVSCRNCDYGGPTRDNAYDAAEFFHKKDFAKAVSNSNRNKAYRDASKIEIDAVVLHLNNLAALNRNKKFLVRSSDIVSLKDAIRAATSELFAELDKKKETKENDYE